MSGNENVGQRDAATTDELTDLLGGMYGLVRTLIAEFGLEDLEPEEQETLDRVRQYLLGRRELRRGTEPNADEVAP